MYLIDTNIFLEILLTQERRGICKNFLDTNIERLYITDFSLHSIGITLFRNNKQDVFERFVNDTLPNIEIITLKKEKYIELTKTKNIYGLDFDDAYQYLVAEERDLEIVTMDKDFEKVEKNVRLIFLEKGT